MNSVLARSVEGKRRRAEAKTVNNQTVWERVCSHFNWANNS